MDQQIKSEKHDRYLLIELLPGDFDLINTPRVSGAIFETLEEHNYPNVLLDLNGLNYIDSSGLSTLIQINKSVREKESAMAVLCGNERILQVLKISNIKNFFNIFELPKEAEDFYTDS
jgi:anti-sigma B factor antagonist